MEDISPSGMTMREIREKLNPLMGTMLKQMEAILDSTDRTSLSPRQRLLYAATVFLEEIWREDIQDLGEGLDDPSTAIISIADRAKFFNRYVSYLAITFGQAARLAEETGNESEALIANETLDEVAALAEEYLKPQFATRRIQVAMHVGTTLLSLLALKEERQAKAKSSS